MHLDTSPPAFTPSQDIEDTEESESNNHFSAKRAVSRHDLNSRRCHFGSPSVRLAYLEEVPSTLESGTMWVSRCWRPVAFSDCPLSEHIILHSAYGGRGAELSLHTLQLSFLQLLASLLLARITKMTKWAMDTVIATLFEQECTRFASTEVMVHGPNGRHPRIAELRLWNGVRKSQHWGGLSGECNFTTLARLERGGATHGRWWRHYGLPEPRGILHRRRHSWHGEHCVGQPQRLQVHQRFGLCTACAVDRRWRQCCWPAFQWRYWPWRRCSERHVIKVVQIKQIKQIKRRRFLQTHATNFAGGTRENRSFWRRHALIERRLNKRILDVVGHVGQASPAFRREGEAWSRLRARDFQR